jgi:hypothetical protein
MNNAWFEEVLLLEDDLLSLMARIGKKAQENGLTEEIFNELLADES